MLTRCRTASTEPVLTVGGLGRAQAPEALLKTQHLLTLSTHHAQPHSPLSICPAETVHVPERKDVPDSSGHSRWRLENPNVHQQWERAKEKDTSDHKRRVQHVHRGPHESVRSTRSWAQNANRGSRLRR